LRENFPHNFEYNPAWTWVFEPWRIDRNDPLVVIVAKIAGLLASDAAPEHRPEGIASLDPRISLPLVMLTRSYPSTPGPYQLPSLLVDSLYKLNYVLISTDRTVPGPVLTELLVDPKGLDGDEKDALARWILSTKHPRDAALIEPDPTLRVPVAALLVH